MNHLTLSASYLKHKPASTALNILTFTLGVALITALLLINAQIRNEFTKNLAGIDLVVGGKGSPMQLILSSVFHIDIPTGNIPLEEADKLSKHMMIKATMPLAMGDNYQSFRIVGTTPAYPMHYGAQLAAGEYWKAPLDAVLGADVAAKSKLALHGHFVGSHGLTAGGEEHEAFPYTVTGILKPTGTVIDRLVLTGIDSVWKIHEHPDEDSEVKSDPAHREITSLLVTYRTPMAAVALPREINRSTSMQAASPAFEVARLMSLMGVGTDTLQAVGGLLMALAGLGIFASLYNAMNERRYDLALMRSLGMKPGKLYALIVTEGMIVSLLSVGLGLLTGHALVHLTASWLMNSKHIHITGNVFLPEELQLIAASLAIGLIAALIPAIRVYRIDIFKTLGQG
jgi:putative ABC transport system permease protein